MKSYHSNRNKFEGTGYEMGKVTIEKEKWSEVPLLHVFTEREKNHPLPTIIYMHGITSSKEHNLPIAYLLAQQGYRVILPDAMLHGEREEEVSVVDLQMRFFDISKQNLDDIEAIYEVLASKNLIEGNRLGVAGTSMGGISTAAALTQFSWIHSAAILMGSPKLTDFATMAINNMKEQAPDITIPEQQVQTILEELDEIDLSRRMETLFNRPLFFWHGEDDPIVPFDHSYSFYQAAVREYSNPDQIQFIREANRGHKVSRMATNELVKWFTQQL